MLTTAQVAATESAILADISACNGIVDLLHTAFGEDASNRCDVAVEAVGALCRVFAKLQPAQYTRTTAAGEQALQEYQKWIRDQYNTCLRFLLDGVREPSGLLSVGELVGRGRSNQ